MANSKEEKTVRVAAATLNIILQNGLRAVTPSRVARSAEVSRPWIYKYIGGDAEDLVKCGVEYFGKVYSRIDENFADITPDAWIADEVKAFKLSLATHDQYPWIVPIYFRFKGSPTPIGKAIEKIESAYLVKKQKQLKKALNLTDKQARSWAEFTTSFKLSLTHRCQFGDLRKFMSHDEIGDGIGFILRGIASELKRK